MSEITSKNTVVVTTSLFDTYNSISAKRRENLKNTISKYNIPIFFANGIKNKNKNKENYMYILSYILIQRIVNFKKTNLDYGIICDDDFHPHSNFLEELNITVSLLPAGWRSLNLCPGYLWGRKFRRCTEPGNLDPENNINDLEHDPTGRFFINCNGEKWSKKAIWLGGPIAILVNKNNVDSLLNDFTNYYNKSPQPNDVILTKILTNNDYVCRSPQLGYENEQGTSTW